MNPYRHHLITRTLALLPTHRQICLAAYDAHRQQGPCPPVWRPYLLYQYRRRQQALRWLLDAVARSLQGHSTVGIYLGALLPDTPDTPVDDYRATLLHVRTTYLQDLLNHTTEDNPTLAFEDYCPPNHFRKETHVTPQQMQDSLLVLEDDGIFYSKFMKCYEAGQVNATAVRDEISAAISRLKLAGSTPAEREEMRLYFEERYSLKPRNVTNARSATNLLDKLTEPTTTTPAPTSPTSPAPAPQPHQPQPQSPCPKQSPSPPKSTSTA